MPLPEYIENCYRGTRISTPPEQGKSSYVCIAEDASSRILIKAMRDDRNGKKIEHEHLSNRLYRYTISKGGQHLGNNLANILKVPDTRIAGSQEKAELIRLNPALESYDSPFLIQECMLGDSLYNLLTAPGRPDLPFGKKSTLQALGVLGGLDVMFCNNDRIPLPPIFSHYGNLGNIMAHEKRNDDYELSAIDNAVAARSENLNKAHIAHVTGLLSKDPDINTVGKTIFDRVFSSIATTASINNIRAGMSDNVNWPLFSYKPQEISDASSWLTEGFVESIALLRASMEDDKFKELVNKVDDYPEKEAKNPGLIQQVLTLMEARGNSAIVDVMNNISEVVPSAASSSK